MLHGISFIYFLYLHLNLIPPDLICLQIQCEAAFVPFVDNGALRLICIIHHTELSVLHIGMDVHIVIL